MDSQEKDYTNTTNNDPALENTWIISKWMCKVTCDRCGVDFEVPAESNTAYPGAQLCWKCRAIWDIEHPVKPEIPLPPPEPVSLWEFVKRTTKRWIKESS
jgi:hypothetical protein